MRSGQLSGTYVYLAQDYLRAEPVGNPTTSGADLVYTVMYAAPYYTEYAFIELSFGAGPYVRAPAIQGNGARDVSGQVQITCAGAAGHALARVYLRTSGSFISEWVPVPPGVREGGIRLTYAATPAVPPPPVRTSIAGVATGRRARFV